MPSPFPGMAPFIESPEGKGCHTTTIRARRKLQMPWRRRGYATQIEWRLFVKHPDNPEPDLVIANGAITREEARGLGVAAANSVAAVTPATCLVTRPEDQRKVYRVVKNLEMERIITLIERLSPSNKWRGTARQRSLAKRDEVRRRATHLLLASTGIPRSPSSTSPPAAPESSP